jgi:hypothetical protein
MELLNCPQCEKPIPDYRHEDPYCDCGWQCDITTEDYDQAGWFTVLFAAVLTAILQIPLLAIVHVASSFALSILSNIAAGFLGARLIFFMHYFLILSIDLLVLGAIYFAICWYLARRNSHPVLMTVVFAFIVIGFKFMVIDPRSNIQYPFLAYLYNLILFVVATGSGFMAASYRKKDLSRFKSGSKMSEDVSLVD